MEESVRIHQARRQQPVELGANLFENEDMITILNARGTVLLNMCFHNTPQQRKVIKLSELALLIWREYKLLSTLSTQSTEDSQVCDPAIQHMIPLIRDDIQKHMLDAISAFSPQHKRDQERHIQIFKTSVQTWKMMRTKRTMADWNQLPTDQQDFREEMEFLRRDYESSLVGFEGRASGLLYGIAILTNPRFHHGSEYISPPLVDGSLHQPAVDELWLPWMERRESSFWFAHIPTRRRRLSLERLDD
ncbi:uncharacterized protein K460DRAFT_362898 [Cucurbitaria berberidis CBS 394.84]|uniref:Uncharacterized protein n=1 Tax=Cucurbitaria berberidis CBS 394.84 TaxID=1168544 RepID=A0A9P4GVI7_9PLEO|nr:uncharacterized protein K460DRAFT_362898 [Cucurbitaria berberidis CBS 394.84]KAF1852130.1 hypothetical protein K460DRAFT_362898 [Cucurbitaria berberidis CBS 394.84]